MPHRDYIIRRTRGAVKSVDVDLSGASSDLKDAVWRFMDQLRMNLRPKAVCPRDFARFERVVFLRIARTLLRLSDEGYRMKQRPAPARRMKSVPIPFEERTGNRSGGVHTVRF
jgi:hypothetical protein